jgi:hypothetical protein
MTCKELGGKCDQKLKAGTRDQTVQAMTKHVVEKRPDVAKEMVKMHKEAKEMGRGNEAELGCGSRSLIS